MFYCTLPLAHQGEDGIKESWGEGVGKEIEDICVEETKRYQD